METTFKNLALFIKRAEEYQSEDFIKHAFEINRIGKVKEIKLIKKQNDFGKNYNGAIIIFERWYQNNLVNKLFYEMSQSGDGTTKFYFENFRYWIINIHKQKLIECEETAIVDSSLIDSEKIKKMEEIIKSMSVKLNYMEKQQELMEIKMMNNEQNETYQHLLNMELRCQLKEKDWERERIEEKYLKEIEILRSRLEVQEEILLRKEEEYETLNQDLQDSNCIISYVENQAQEMKQMLRTVLETDPIKPIINSYIKEYLD